MPGRGKMFEASMTEKTKEEQRSLNPARSSATAITRPTFRFFKCVVRILVDKTFRDLSALEEFARKPLLGFPDIPTPIIHARAKSPLLEPIEECIFSPFIFINLNSFKIFGTAASNRRFVEYSEHENLGCTQFHLLWQGDLLIVLR